MGVSEDSSIRERLGGCEYVRNHSKNIIIDFSTSMFLSYLTPGAFGPFSLRSDTVIQ